MLLPPTPSLNGSHDNKMGLSSALITLKVRLLSPRLVSLYDIVSYHDFLAEERAKSAH